MARVSRVAITLLVMALTTSGCYFSVPAPPQHDHASLRCFFGDTPTQLQSQWGKPDSIVELESLAVPEDASPEQLEEFRSNTKSRSFVYPTMEGDLIFHFNQNDQVFAIEYAGQTVAREP